MGGLRREEFLSKEVKVNSTPGFAPTRWVQLVIEAPSLPTGSMKLNKELPSFHICYGLTIKGEKESEVYVITQWDLLRIKAPIIPILGQRK